MRSYTRPSVSEEAEEEVRQQEGETTLRRGLLGYRRADVERALAERDESVDDLATELDARDAELAELRQDIAALWLAFAQHDRMLGELRTVITAAQPEPDERAEPEGFGPAEEREADLDPEAREDASGLEAPAASVGRQLADLDEVLAAIEMATQTLEQTYAEEVEATAEELEGERSDGD